MENQMKLRLPLAVTIFIILNVQITTADLNSDAEALLTFASSVPHLRKLNWNSTTPICTSWFGIKCNDAGTRVTAVHLPGVGIYGPIPPNTIGKLDALKIFSLRSNFLTGNLPSDIPSIPSLQSLYLQRNNFSGNFPVPLSPQLTILDLSFNSLSGVVPELNLTRLRALNISYNTLIGSIPKSLQKFPSSSFEGNSLLCGQPLSQCLTISDQPLSSSSPSPSNVHKKLSTKAIVGIAIGGLLIVLLKLVFFFYCCLKVQAVNAGKNEKSEDNKLVFIDGSVYNFDVGDLLSASAEVLGKGSYIETAYKVILDEETTMVVKRIREIGVKKKEFEQHMEFAGGIGKKHPNIVPVGFNTDVISLFQYLFY